MSLHISVVAIRGDHIGRAGDLLGLFGDETEDGPIEVTGWDAAAGPSPCLPTCLTPS